MGRSREFYEVATLIFKKNMDAPLYQTVVKRRLRNDRMTFAPDAPARLPTSYQFLQDNAPWHTCDDSMSELQELVDDRIIGHPAQSPDLNIMEDLWSYLDRKAKAAKIKTLQGLKRKRQWNGRSCRGATFERLYSQCEPGWPSVRNCKAAELNISLSSNKILITGSELTYG